MNIKKRRHTKSEEEMCRQQSAGACSGWKPGDEEAEGLSFPECKRFLTGGTDSIVCVNNEVSGCAGSVLALDLNFYP